MILQAMKSTLAEDSNAAFVFNCHEGKGRTTTAMVIALLILWHFNVSIKSKYRSNLSASACVCVYNYDCYYYCRPFLKSVRMKLLVFQMPSTQRESLRWDNYFIVEYIFYLVFIRIVNYNLANYGNKLQKEHNLQEITRTRNKKKKIKRK